MKKVVFSLVAVLMLVAASAQAQVFKLSLWGPICVPNGDYTGGLEIGIGSSTQEVEGVQFDFIYSRAEKLTGVQWGVVTIADEFTGVQLNVVGIAKEFKGLQWGGVNIASENFTGAQIGWVNYAKEFKGLQFGIVNWANTTMEGLQLGLVNVIKENKQFLPVFVIFNFCFK